MEWTQTVREAKWSLASLKLPLNREIPGDILGVIDDWGVLRGRLGDAKVSKLRRGAVGSPVGLRWTGCLGSLQGLGLH